VLPEIEEFRRGDRDKDKIVMHVSDPDLWTVARNQLISRAVS
jgi:hypothetical protein